MCGTVESTDSQVTYFTLFFSGSVHPHLLQPRLLLREELPGGQPPSLDHQPGAQPGGKHQPFITPQGSVETLNKF
jgi:hypothetical protein